MKRMAALTLAFVFLLSFTLNAFAAEPEDLEESELKVTEITSAEDFLLFSSSCSRDVYSQDAVFRLTADIDLSAADFSGVPYFAGIFDGNGHRIMGVSIACDGSRQGLFRRVAEGAVIRDLNVSGAVEPGGTRQYIGGIAGLNAGRLENCSFSGTVSGLDAVGGIAGLNETSGQIISCRFSGSLTGEHQVGGVAGDNAGVILRCVNSGRINTEPIVPQREGHFDLAVLSEDDFLDLSNIGGVTGNNTGVVDECRNGGEVGYKNSGYNVGGIAGKTSGFLNACENSAAVDGRRDVGGIAGQLVPQLRWDYSNDKLETIGGQLGSLSYLISKASRHSSEKTDELSAEFARVNDSTSLAISELERILREAQSNDSEISDSFHIDPDTGEIVIDPANLSSLDTGKLTAALTDLNAEFKVVSEILDSSIDELTDDMAKILRQMTGIMGSMMSVLNGNEDGKLYTEVDLSADECYKHDIGAVADCVNYGEVRAENNAGGIVGTVGFEVSFDMEDSLDASRFITAEASALVFAVIRGSRSCSDVQVKNDHVGCVAGSMDVGAAVDCVGTGSVESANGDYAGGIAGESQGTIRGCWSRAVLSGGKYVGGAAGLGRSIENCRCWTHIERASEYAGAVAGWAEGNIVGNLYADASPAGIDGISFSGMTDPVTQSQLLALADLPEDFGDLTVSFVADGITVAEIKVPFGGSVKETPAVENDGERYWKWDDFNKEHIYHSMQISGKYYAPGTTLSSGEDLPQFLVEGVFYEGQKLTVAQYPTERDDVLASNTLYVDGYEGELNVHMLCSESGRLYLVGRDGTLNASSYKTDGQYIVFKMDNGGSFVFLQSAPYAGLPLWVAVGSAAIVVASLSIILFAKRQKSKKAADTVIDG